MLSEAVNDSGKVRKKYFALRRSSCDLVAFLHPFSRFHYWDPCWHILLSPMPVGWGLFSCPLLPSVHLAGHGRLGRAPHPAPPPLTSADFSSPLPGLPEQAACVWGWEGLGGRHCDASHPSQPASVAAFGAGGEPAMAELAARTGWIFLHRQPLPELGRRTKAQKDGMA